MSAAGVAPTFAEAYLAGLEAYARGRTLPRIKALHLPPTSAEGAFSGKGEFCAVALENGAIGLSYVLLDRTLAELLHQGDKGLIGSDALAVARHYVQGQGVLKTLGFAVANALTRCLYDEAGFVPPSSRDSIGQMALQAGEEVGMIGFFKPLLGRIVSSGARLTVVELDPALVGEGDGYRVTLDPSALAQCTQVVSTSTLLLNATLDTMLAHCKRARTMALVGPSAGCLPDALFARGVTLLGGTWIEDGPGFLQALRQGESTSPYSRKTALTPATYPGLAALLKGLG